MKIEHPEVTLNDEKRGFEAETGRSGFLDWLYEFNVEGDDGEQYALGGSILSMKLEQMDLVTLCMAKGRGSVRQIRGSIYKTAEYPGAEFNKMIRSPQGTLKIEEREHSVYVSCGPAYNVECFEDGRWHIRTDSADGVYKADLWHYGRGCPLWYGREKPSYLTPHSVTYGYNWSGDVEGEFTYRGKTVRVKGTGQRERYAAVDSSAAELGAWEDWGFITFREVYSSMYDMKLGMKDFAVYDMENDRYYPEGELVIEHEDWVFLRELDGFIPSQYKIRIEVEDGTFQFQAHVGNARTWGVIFRVPECPVATLIFDSAEGCFIRKDGSVRKLTDGRGTISVRQWHEYPRILPRELYLDEEKYGERFETL